MLDGVLCLNDSEFHKEENRVVYAQTLLTEIAELADAAQNFNITLGGAGVVGPQKRNKSVPSSPPIPA